MLVIYSLMAFALVRLSWHRRGMIAVLVTIIIAGQFLDRGRIARSRPRSSARALRPIRLVWQLAGFWIQRRYPLPDGERDSAAIGRFRAAGWMQLVWDLLARPLTTRKERAWANRLFDLDGDVGPLLGGSQHAWWPSPNFSAVVLLVVADLPGQRIGSELGQIHRRDDGLVHRRNPPGDTDLPLREALS